MSEEKQEIGTGFLMHIDENSKINEHEKKEELEKKYAKLAKTTKEGKDVVALELEGSQKVQEKKSDKER